MKELLAAASVCALLVAAPAWAQNAAHPNTGTAPLSQQDKIFVQKAGDGSLAEVELGRLAEQRGANPAVREFGRWMATDHQLANNWLKEILASQNETVQPRLTTQDQQLHQKLEGLHGVRFDREYMQAMVADHEKDVPAFRKQASEGQNPMIKNFAAGLTPVLEQHLAEAKLLAGETGVAARRSISGEGYGSSTQR